MALTEEKKVKKEVEEELLQEDAKEEEENVEVAADKEEVAQGEEDIQDVDLSITRKKRFRIDGDNNRILEIDISDMGILKRLDSINPKLDKLAEDASMLLEEDGDSSTDEIIGKTAKTLEKIDTQMRNLLDELFDANVSEVCAPSGTMYDPFGGKFRYEHILDVVSKLYEKNLAKEFSNMARNINKHTKKYVKK